MNIQIFISLCFIEICVTTYCFCLSVLLDSHLIKANTGEPVVHNLLHGIPIPNLNN